jgi:cold shock CspA family protein
MAAGVVEAWDDPRGVGTVLLDDGRLLDLQCTHIADGSRTTAVGTRVEVGVAPGHLGRWQAVAVHPA